MTTETTVAPPSHTAQPARSTTAVVLLIEIAVIIVWALFVTRPYQTMNPDDIPIGREYLSAIQTHHVWNWVKQCGPCAFWNGSHRGGAPSFADPYGSMLHPLVILTTLIWDVRNGAKIALVAVFMLGGVAQWWLAYVLGLGRLARMWSGLLAVVAGHLGARAENGNFGLLLSTVACALVLPPLIAFLRDGSRRMAIVLGVMTAQALVSGQGYMQIGLACLLPLALLLPIAPHRWALVRRAGIAALVALLLASAFLIPFLHFLPNFQKDIAPDFPAATPFVYMPLHFVIDNAEFYTTRELQKLPYPYLYMNFIGWIPLLLALWAIVQHHKQQQPYVRFLALGALMVLWIASGGPLAWAAQTLPSAALAEQLAGIRFHPVIAGLAVPLVLGLAAIRVNHLEQWYWRYQPVQPAQRWSRIRFLLFDWRAVIAIPLVLALLQSYQFNSQWIATVPLQREVEPVLQSLRTDSLQWVNPPFGEHAFVEPAVGKGYKMTFGYRTWNWRGRVAPQPYLEADRKGVAAGMQRRTTVGDISINVADDVRDYASLNLANGQRAVCPAQGLGGNIDIRCTIPVDGELVVLENSWTGWQAEIDGQPVSLQDGQWLRVSLPAGEHHVVFRYWPWDGLLGVSLSAIGFVLVLVLWRFGEAPLPLRRAKE
ncbi:MAG: hypothetical protein H7Z42_21270 [Roseiflexaceae bacterium]|nr:hypothetical protein [Roseiflexaceae bacterium]